MARSIKDCLLCRSPVSGADCVFLSLLQIRHNLKNIGIVIRPEDARRFNIKRTDEYEIVSGRDRLFDGRHYLINVFGSFKNYERRGFYPVIPTRHTMYFFVKSVPPCVVVPATDCSFI